MEATNKLEMSLNMYNQALPLYKQILTENSFLYKFVNQ